MSRRRNTRLVAGAGAVTLVAALAAAALVMMKGDASAGRSVVTPAGDTASQTGAGIDASLDSLERIVSGVTVSRDDAGNVLRELARVQGSVQTDKQIVHAAIVRAMAQSSLQDSTSACRTLRDVEPIATKTEFRKRVSTTIGVACNQ